MPSLADQEREDQVHEGSYAELVVSGGSESVDEGQHVPSIERLLARDMERGIPCHNRVRQLPSSAELNQIVSGRVRVIERARSGGEATSNVQASPVSASRFQGRGD